MSGVYFITTRGLESLLTIFNVQSDQTERLFGIILPRPVRPVKDVITLLSNKVELEGEYEISLYPKEQDKNDYLNDVDNIKAMMQWINERGKN